jgi:hypothetical protein
MGVQGIIAIGKRLLCAARLPFFEIAVAAHLVKDA